MEGIKYIDEIIDLEIQAWIEDGNENYRKITNVLDVYIESLGISHYHSLARRHRALYEECKELLTTDKPWLEQDRKKLEGLSKVQSEMLGMCQKSLFRVIDEDREIRIRFQSIIFATQYWKLAQKREVWAYNLGHLSKDFNSPGNDSEKVRQRALEVKQALKKPAKIGFDSAYQLFYSILNEERKGERLFVAGLPAIGIKKPVVYHSLFRHESNAESGEQILMKRILGFSPPFF